MHAEMEVKGLWLIRGNVRRRQSTIVEYVSGRLIYEMCTVVKKMEGSGILLRW